MKKESLIKVLGEKDYNLYNDPSTINKYTDREVQENEHDYLCDAYNTLINESIYKYYSDLHTIFSTEREKRNLEELPRLFAL